VNALRAMVVSLAVLLQIARGSSENEMRFERTFADAARAYDANRLPDAISGWESLVGAGQDLPEVLFNLGNAYYRNGNIGKAILAYRQAQRLAPRDPDIRANLGFAAQTAGIALPERKPVAALLLDISRHEWLAWGSTCFWLLFLSLAAWISWPRFRFATRPACAGLAALLMVALAGLWMHRDLRQTPECVVMAGGQKVLSGPLDSATPILAAPEGAIIRKLDQRGAWIEVQYDATRGWLPATAATPVR
jgi:tetratricopeptide (TPR) repeat protein